MIRVWMRRLCAACALLSAWSVFPAAADAPVPPLTARVVDKTGTLSATEQAELERTLAEFEARKGSQIAVLLVPTTEPETIEQYSMRVVEQWKLGRKKVDDGALLLIAKDDRTLRIEVGYGLEGALSDIVSKRIISEDIVPHLRKGDFAAGIRAGVDRMIRVIDGEPLPSPPPQQNYSNTGGPSLNNALPVILIFAVIGGGILRAMLGPLPGALATGGLVAVGAWLLLGVLSFALIAGLIAAVATLAGIGRGGFGGGGFRGGGGFGGGGFSGGGGGFGGGGASGRF
ncbi:MAG: YgcG family protein [Rhodocyclaceae bacterium]|nr:YgcG family protein [Rhodocyclaceae bacterium]